MLKHETSIDETGTFLVGMIRATYQELENVLGKPDFLDGFKISTEWKVKRAGQIFTVYDWKMTSNYEKDLPTPERLRECPYPLLWHIGSSKHEKVDSFVRELSKLMFEDAIKKAMPD